MKKLLLILFLCAAAVACSKSEDYAQPYTHRIIAIASANGIGDQGYIDMIVAGYERVYCSLDQSVYMQICTPLTPEEAYEIAIQSIEKAKDGVPTLVILGSSEYQPVVERLRTDTSLSGSNVSILLFETDAIAPASNNLNYYSFMITCYKACYNAGKYVAEKGFASPLIWLAHPLDRQLDFFRDGFSDGYFDRTGKRPDVEYLSDDWTGFSMSDVAYRSMESMSEKYDFIFPVTGGSNLGIYRYLRENPDGPYVAGMDYDQSRYANNIIGCLMKNIDNTVVDFVTAWMEGEVITPHTTFDATSGYVEWRVMREVDLS